MKIHPGGIFAHERRAASWKWVRKHFNCTTPPSTSPLSQFSLNILRGPRFGQLLNLLLASFDGTNPLKWRCVNTLQRFGRSDLRDSVHHTLKKCMYSSFSQFFFRLVLGLNRVMFSRMCLPSCTLVFKINIFMTLTSLEAWNSVVFIVLEIFPLSSRHFVLICHHTVQSSLLPENLALYV